MKILESTLRRSSGSRRFHHLIELGLLLAGLGSTPAHGWTYYFIISGDRDQSGPTWIDATEQPGQSSRIEDQGLRFYERVQTLARADTLNRYVLYYDPRGGGSSWWPTLKASRLEVYSRGREILNSSWPETDSTDIAFFSEWIQAAEDAILVRDSVHRVEDPTLFYYYGEHLPSTAAGASKKLVHDESAPHTHLSIANFGKILQIISRIVRYPALVILQSCNVASVELLSAIPHIAAYPTTVLAPSGTVANAAPQLEMLKNSTLGPRRLADAFVAGQDRVRYRFEFERFLTDAQFDTALKALRDLERRIDARVWNQHLGDWLKTRQIESASAPVLDPGLGEGELMLPLPAYLELLDQFASTPIPNQLPGVDLSQGAWSKLLKTLLPTHLKT